MRRAPRAPNVADVAELEMLRQKAKYAAHVERLSARYPNDIFAIGPRVAAIGISANKFRALVGEKRMPSPRRLDGRNIWDVDELRAAFKALPYSNESEKVDTWADVV